LGAVVAISALGSLNGLHGLGQYNLHIPKIYTLYISGHVG